MALSLLRRHQRYRRWAGEGSVKALLEQFQQRATFVDGVKLRWVRDRGLDHAVEKEQHLLPLHFLKDLLLSSPDRSLYLSSISRHRLCLPFRPIRFIRKYPSAFLEDLPPQTPLPSGPSRNLEESNSDSNPFHPRIRPTPDLIKLHEEELSVYESCRAEAADRLLRLLMLMPRRKVPVSLVDMLRWDFGLPKDYAQSLLPDFPDYFQLVDDGSGNLELELVCYSRDLAISAMEKRSNAGYQKGMALAFPVNYSRGFELEKKVKKWMEEWQKLPYISPYENGSASLDPTSPVAEKWTVGLMHELLNLLVPKKTDKENLLLLGEHLGMRTAFKKALVNYPGIFYVSNKNGSSTVVIRDAYKRNLLIEKHPLMDMRYKYIHLMHKSVEEEKLNAVGRQKSDKFSGANCIEDEEIEDSEDEEEDIDEEEEEAEREELSRLSDSDLSVKVSSSEDDYLTDEKILAQEQAKRTENSHGARLSLLENRLMTRKVFQAPVRRKKKSAGSVGSCLRSKKKPSRFKAAVA